MNKQFTHIDLFSGIGGFSLAVDEVWGCKNIKHIFCEINPFCQAVLRKNFGKDILIYDDIRRLATDTDRSGSGASTSRTDKDGRRLTKDKKNSHSLSLANKVAFSSPEASLVSPSRTPVKEKEQKMTVFYGQRCLRLYQVQNRHGSSLKMCVDYLLSKADWYSSKCALIWEEKITKYNRLLFQLVPSTRHIAEIGCGLSGVKLLETPRCVEAERSNVYKGRTLTPTEALNQLNRQIARTMFPTPRSREGNAGSAGSAGSVHNAERGYLDGLIQESGIEIGMKSPLKLAPAMVEWMMGYPLNYTDLNSPSQSTEKSG